MHDPTHTPHHVRTADFLANVGVPFAAPNVRAIRLDPAMMHRHEAKNDPKFDDGDECA